MGKQHISALGPEHTRISFRVSAELARKMRQDGWQVTQKMLYGSTAHKLARRIAPKNDPDAPLRLEVRICRLAGFLPMGDGTTVM